MPKVSIIIPVYNAEKYITKCLDSIINQTFKDIEIICINDGSIDNSLQILQQYAKQDHRVKIVDQKNQGVSMARNCGISVASGDFLMFVDNDDWIDSSTIELSYNKIIEDNSDILVFGHYGHFENNKQIQFNLPRNIPDNPFYFENCHSDFFYCITSCWGKLFKHKKDNIYFNTKLKLVEDTVFYWQKCLENPKVTVLNKYLYYYRQYDNSTIHNTEAILNNEVIKGIQYLISQNSFKNASKNVQVHILDRFMQSINYQIDVLLKDTVITNKYCKGVEYILNKISKYDKQLLSDLRYYDIVKSKIKNLKPTPIKDFVHIIFSVKNEYKNNTKRKVITILGIKIKFKIGSKPVAAESRSSI